MPADLDMRGERAMARLSRVESRALTREKLLDAARLTFARNGYEGASVDAISEAAGFSKGAFYSNFESKEALFLELLRQHMAREVEDLNALLVEGATFDQIMAALGHWLDEMNKDDDWPLLSIQLQLHARRHSDLLAEYEALNKAHRAALGSLIARLFAAAGKALPRPAPDIAATFMALAHGVVLQRGARGPKRDKAGPLIKMVLDSLIAAAPAAPRKGHAT